MKKLLKDNRGQAFPLVALLMVVIIAMCGLVVDGGSLYSEKSKAQNAVDAAALAAAKIVATNPGNVTQTAKQYGADNGLDKENIQVSMDKTKNTVTVTATQTVPFYFMQIFGKASSDVFATATAKVEGNPKSAVYDYVLFSEDPNAYPAFSGNMTVDGDVHINGSSAVSGNSHFNGMLEVGKSFTKSGNAHIKKLVNPAKYIPMPEFNINYSTFAA